MILIPAIDLKDNKCVRLTKGKEHSSTTYNDNPLEQAKFFEDQGCERLHIIDLDAAFGRPEVNKNTIINIKKTTKIPIQLGGGIRSKEILKNYFDQGIDFLIIGSFAVEKPDIVETLSNEYNNRIYFALDVLDNKIMIKGWKNQSDLFYQDVFKRFNYTKIKGYILTDVSRDGMMKGIDTKLINENLKLTKKNLIVGGGLSTYKDLNELSNLQSQFFEGIIIGKSFYEGNIEIKKGMEILNKNA